jgi:hypothetical protein
MTISDRRRTDPCEDYYLMDEVKVKLTSKSKSKDDTKSDDGDDISAE